MSKFSIPPISTLVGATLPHYLRVLKSGKISPKYYFKIFLTTLFVIAGIPFRLYEQIYDSLYLNQKLKKSPTFILGHWRSGTTHLHNILCQDPEAAFITTYHSLFPNNLRSKFIFKNFMKMNMPNKRPSDNVTLDVNYPQEEEFALGNQISLSLYLFFYFPQNYLSYYNSAVNQSTASEKEKTLWKKHYHKLLLKAQSNTNGDHLVIKNPSNTGRIHALLELYPDAKFVHLSRNPVIVYLSTKKFFLSIIPTLQLQKFSSDQIINQIFHLYSMLMRDYFDQRSLIPQENLIELKFEDLEDNPHVHLANIYKQFEINSYQNVKGLIENYLMEHKNYTKNSYSISQVELDRIKNEWDFAFKKLGYEIPENLHIV
ncbi:MAG: sulfotransferase [Reichenbachiella sp.]